jgi:hypothetical protein
MNEREPHNPLPHFEFEPEPQDKPPEYLTLTTLDGEFTDYYCPICPGGGWTMRAIEVVPEGGYLEMWDEVVILEDGDVYLVCPNCDAHFPEDSYDAYL